MPSTFSDYLLAGGVANRFVRLVNNATAAEYISTAATTATGLFTFNPGPPAGIYTVYMGPLTGLAGPPWTALGNSNYVISYTAGDDAALDSLTLDSTSPFAPANGVSLGGAAFSPSDFWAPRPNGSDDTTVLATLLTAMPSTGGSLILGQGTYQISSYLDNIRNGVTIRGSTRGGTVLKRLNSTNQPMIRFLGTTECTVENVTFDQNGQNQSSNGWAIYMNATAHNLTVQNNIFNNAGTSAVFVVGGPSSRPNNLRILNNDVVAYSGSTGDLIVSLSQGGLTQGNRVTFYGQLAINVYEANDHPCIGNTLIGNGSAGQGIAVSSSLNCPVIGNSLALGSNDTGLVVMKETDNGGSARAQTQATLIGNMLRGTGGTPLGVSLQNCSGVTIEGNTFDSLYQVVGYSIATIDDVLVQNNRALTIGAGGFHHTGVTPTNARSFNNVGFDPQGLQAPAFAASYTPDLTLGNVISMGALTAGVTVNAIANPWPGQRVTFIWTQDGTGNRAITWNAAYNTAWQPVQGASAVSSISFVYNGTVWQQDKTSIALSQAGSAYMLGSAIFGGTVSASTVNSTGADNKFGAGATGASGSFIDAGSLGTSDGWVTAGHSVNSNAALKLQSKGTSPVEVTTSLKTDKDIQRSKQTPSEAVLVSGVDATAGEIIAVTLTAARVVGAPLNPATGQRLTFTLVQGGAGAFAVTWNATFVGLTWADTGNAAGKRSTISFYYGGTTWNQDGAQAPYAT